MVLGLFVGPALAAVERFGFGGMMARRQKGVALGLQGNRARKWETNGRTNKEKTQHQIQNLPLIEHKHT